MITLNNSDSVIIVIHEIYGVNQHIVEVCNHFKMSGFDIICPNLLNLNEPFGYDEEEAAYEYFIKNVGFDLAAEKVKKLIIQAESQYKHIFLLGFSIGATIAWLCSKEDAICEGIIGYYGSRIRNYLEIVPNCPTLLIFAKEEKSFDIGKIVSILERKENVNTYVLSGKHGFGDPFCKRFYEESYQNAIKLVDNFLGCK